MFVKRFLGSALSKLGLILILGGLNYSYAQCSLSFTSPTDQAIVSSPNIVVYGQGGASASLGNVGTVTATLNGSVFFQQTGHFTSTVTFFRTRGVPVVLQEGANTLTVSGSVGGCSASDRMTVYYYPGGEPPVSCTCNELKNTATNTCTPLAPSSEWDRLQQVLYEYPDNNHSDAPRCEPIPVPESDASCSNTSTANPIDCATGQKRYTDLDYQGFGLDALSHRRQYYSPLVSDQEDDADTDAEPVLASPWRSLEVPSLQRRQLKDGAEVLTFRMGSGLQRVFFNPAGATQWSSNALLKPLSLDTSDGYVVRLTNGRTFAFNSTLQAQQQGNEQGEPRFFYEYIDVLGESKVARVSNRFDRSLSYHYNSEGLLSQLVDQDGLTVHYRYDDQQNLIEVWQGGAELSDATLVKRYVYERTDLPHHITGVFDHADQRIATIAYDDAGKAIRSELAEGAERVDVSYPEDGRAVVKHYRDTSTNAYREEHYRYAKFRGQYQLTSKTITQCEQCDLTTETWDFNDRGLLLRHTSPGGRVTEYGYDQQDRKIRQTVAANTPDTTTTTYTWDDTHMQIASITTATEVTMHVFDADGNIIQTLTTPVH